MRPTTKKSSTKPRRRGPSRKAFRTYVSCWVTEATAKAFTRFAKRWGQSRSSLVRQALEAYEKKHLK